MKVELSARNLLATSAIASAATTVAAVVLSSRETGKSAAALNAVSHMVWGDAALREDHWDARHSLTGGALNAAAMVSWSAIYELLPRPKTVPGALLKGVFVSALAYTTDFFVVPKRFSPGFEHRLSPTALSVIYGIMATALSVRAAAAAVSRR